MRETAMVDDLIEERPKMMTAGEGAPGEKQKKVEESEEKGKKPAKEGIEEEEEEEEEERRPEEEEWKQGSMRKMALIKE